MSNELSLGRRISFSLVLVVLVLLVVEGTSQLFYRVTAGDFLFRRAGAAPIFEEDPTRCYRLKSNLEHVHKTNEFETAIYTNSQGLRTDASRRDLVLEKPAGVYRILFLGASFAFGWGNEFEQTYPTLIGERLQAAGMPIQIVNLGTPGQRMDHQLCWLEREGARFQADLVVQTVSGQQLPAVAAGCPEPRACPVIKDSKLYTVAPTLQRKVIATVKNLGIVFYGYYAYQWVLRLTSSTESVGPVAGAGMEPHEGEAVLREADYESLSRHFGDYEANIARILGPNVPVVFLFVPMSFVVHPGDAPRWSHLLEADPLTARERIRADVDALRARGHLVVDTTPALIERADQERLYYWLDIHPNPAGNRTVAETAVPVLRERLEAMLARDGAPLPASSANNSAMRSLPARK